MKKIERFGTLGCYGILVDRTNFPSEELIYKDGNYYLPVNDSVEMDAVTCNITYVSTEPLDFDNLESIVEKTGAEGLTITSIPEGMEVSIIYNIEEE